MKITDIAPQQKGELYNIFFDGQFAFSADGGFIAENFLHKGDEFSPSAFEELKSLAEVQKAYRHGLYLLGYRDFSSKELIKRLCRKGVDEIVAEAAVEKIKAAGYINDERYAEKLVEHHKQKSGSRKILYELQKSGIDRETAEEALENGYSEEDGIEAILRDMRRRFKPPESDDPAEKRKQINKIFNRYIARGYAFETVKRAYNLFTEELFED